MNSKSRLKHVGVRVQLIIVQQSYERFTILTLNVKETQIFLRDLKNDCCVLNWDGLKVFVCLNSMYRMLFFRPTKANVLFRYPNVTDGNVCRDTRATGLAISQHETICKANETGL